MSKNLLVNEIFGPTVQGEGRNLGMPVMFLRLAVCNQHCVWCDTPYTWRFSDKFPHENNIVYERKNEIKPMDSNSIIFELLEWKNRWGVNSLVISGGEPMLQQKNLIDLVNKLRLYYGWWVEIETAGTVIPNHDLLLDLYTVSPKLSNSGNSDSRINSNALNVFSELAVKDKAVFKFVVANEKDMQEVDEIVNNFGLTNVYIMPLGIDANVISENLQNVTEYAIQRNYKITTRLHISIFGNKRGV